MLSLINPAIGIGKSNLSRLKLIPNLAPALAMILSLYLSPVIESGDRSCFSWLRSSVIALKTQGTKVRSPAQNSWSTSAIALQKLLVYKSDRLLKTLGI